MVKKDKKKQGRIVGCIISFIVVLIGFVVVGGAMNGWFEDEKVIIGEEYIGEFTDFKTISATEYEELINKKDSFILLVDQTGCDTADKVRGFAENWGKEEGVKVLRIMFAEMRETSLHNEIKYYPSVAVISKGRLVGFLRADSDEDAEKFNSYEVFKGWMGKYI